jgi:subtilisin family serine protease
VVTMGDSPRLTATAPLADFGFGGASVPGSMTGKTCLVSRGTSNPEVPVYFSDKVLNCAASGGVAAVLYNNVPEAINPTLGGVVTTIPSVFATQADGAVLLSKVGTSATVAVVGNPALYASYNGTSMATPHASAVAALVWSNFPSCSVAQIRNALTASAMDLGAGGRDNDYGFGLIQAKAAVDYLTANGCAAP